MEIIIYADESGTFDKINNDIFVFGGVIYLSKIDSDNAGRKYIHVENTLRKTTCKGMSELKACLMSNKDKGKIFRSLNGTIKFGVIIRQKNVLNEIFASKKSKQRFLDYAFKIGLKRCLEDLMRKGVFKQEDVTQMVVYMDEHTTATNGRYELREALEQEFKYGTFNMNYNIFYPPLFSNLQSINLQYCNSAKKTLVRAADIVANRLYYYASNGKEEQLNGKINIHNIP